MVIKNIIRSALIIFLVFSLIGIVKNGIQIKKTGERMFSAQRKVESLEKQKNELILGQEDKKSEGYLEKQIRNELKMVKPGENLVLMPGEFLDRKKDEMYKYGLEDVEELNESYNYKKWVMLFW